MPFGARVMKPTMIRPTISRLAAEEMVTIAASCTTVSRIAPMTGPIQLTVPPTSGMAMVFTA